MKRIIAVVGVVLGLGAIGLTAASASTPGQWSHACTDGSTPPNEHHVVDHPVTVSYENPGPTTDPDYVMVCYSTTPNGSSAPEAAGGAFVVRYTPTGAYESTLEVASLGDRTGSTMATVDCSNHVWTTDDLNPSTSGRSVSGQSSFGAAGPLGLGRTGADVAGPDTSTTTSGATPGGSTGTGTGSCAYVDGSTPHSALCPSGANVAGANVATGDASVTPTVNPGGCVTAFGNPCFTTAPSGAGVVVAKGDPSNDTVSTTVLGTPVSEDLGDCYGYNMGSCP